MCACVSVYLCDSYINIKYRLTSSVHHIQSCLSFVDGFYIMGMDMSNSIFFCYAAKNVIIVTFRMWLSCSLGIFISECLINIEWGRSSKTKNILCECWRRTNFFHLSIGLESKFIAGRYFYVGCRAFPSWHLSSDINIYSIIIKCNEFRFRYA